MKMKWSFLILFSLQQVYGSTALRMCYVSPSTSLVLPRANDTLREFGGFKSALKIAEKLTPSEFLIYKGSDNLNGLTAMEDAIRWAKEKKCHVLVGLVSSREALIASKLLQPFDLAGFSSTATADELVDQFPAVMSASTSMQSLTRALGSLLSESNKNFILMLPGDTYSTLFTDKLTKKIKNFVVLRLNSQKLIPENSVGYLLSEKKYSIVYTTYPLASIPSLKQMSQLIPKQSRKNITLFGTHSWMETHTFNANKEILRNLPAIKLFNPWKMEAPTRQYEEFKKVYYSLYGVMPDHDSAYDFDVAQLILRCFDKQNINPEKSLKKCLSEKKSFLGATGLYEYDGSHPHPIRKEHLVSLDSVKMPGGIDAP